MKLEGTMLSEISQTEKDTYHMISLMCGILKKEEEKSQPLRKREIRFVVTRVGDGEMKTWMKVVKRYKLPATR